LSWPTARPHSIHSSAVAPTNAPTSRGNSNTAAVAKKDTRRHPLGRRVRREPPSGVPLAWLAAFSLDPIAGDSEAEQGLPTQPARISIGSRRFSIWRAVGEPPGGRWPQRPSNGGRAGEAAALGFRSGDGMVCRHIAASIRGLDAHACTPASRIAARVLT
jgi:hypothetical protein